MGRVLVQLPGTTTAKALTETLSKNVIIVDEDLHQLRLHDGSTAGGHLIGNSAGSGVPVGTIIPFAGNSVPQGYLLCDGSAISRTTYASLFAVIGTIYGAGDGSTTFNLPNFTTGASIISGTPGLIENGGVPNLIGDFSVATGKNGGGSWLKADYAWGAIQLRGTGNTAILSDTGSFTGTNSFRFDASTVSSVYNNSQKVFASGVKTKICIKY